MGRYKSRPRRFPKKKILQLRLSLAVYVVAGLSAESIHQETGFSKSHIIQAIALARPAKTFWIYLVAKLGYDPRIVVEDELKKLLRQIREERWDEDVADSG